MDDMPDMYYRDYDDDPMEAEENAPTLEGAETNTESQRKAGTKVRFRFLPAADILLLKQVLADRPFDAGYGRVEDAWDLVLANLRLQGINWNVSAKNVRDRYSLLIEKFKKNEIESLRRSGSAEEYDDREKLLTELVEMQEAARDDAENRKQKIEIDAAKAKDVRDAAMLTLKQKRKQSPNTSTSDLQSGTHSRKKLSIVGIAAEREDRRKDELEHKKQLLEFEREKLRVEERKIELKAKDHEEKRRIRAEEMKSQAEQAAAQANAFLLLAQAIHDKK